MLFEDGRVGSISSNHLGGDAARDAQKESPGLVTKARSRRRPSFYAATPSFSSSDDAPLSLLKLEAGAAPIRLTAASYLTTRSADWCAGCRNPKLTSRSPANNLLVTGRSWETKPCPWASAAFVEVDAAGSKLEALEGEEWTSAFSICPILITRSQGFGRDLSFTVARAFGVHRTLRGVIFAMLRGPAHSKSCAA